MIMDKRQLSIMLKDRMQVYDEDGCLSLVQGLFYEPILLKRWDPYNPLTFHVLYFDGTVHELSAYEMHHEEDLMQYAEMAFGMLTCEREDIKEQLEMTELRMPPNLSYKSKEIEQLDWVSN